MIDDFVVTQKEREATDYKSILEEWQQINVSRFKVSISHPILQLRDIDLTYHNLSQGDSRRNQETVRNGGNANQMKEFFYETSGFDRINTNTHLGIITYRKQPSMMVRRTNTLVMFHNNIPMRINKKIK